MDGDRDTSGCHLGCSSVGTRCCRVPGRAADRVPGRGHATSCDCERRSGSGTVELEITEDGDLWVGRTLRWNGTDLSISSDEPRESAGGILVVDGIMYGPDPETPDGWIEMGSPDSIDPDSGTTPDEYLAAIGEDVGGATMQRLTDEMTDLTTSQAEDGSTIYHGKVPAGSLARETGVKEGESIRFPSGTSPMTTPPIRRR